MIYKVASSFAEVLDAWSLVYHQYLTAGLIKPNDYSIFTFPEYLSNNAAVIIGKENGVTTCTASAVLDSKLGLPLDTQYKKELDHLRTEGRKLIEIGLVADSRNHQNFSDVIELMNSVARFGPYSKHLDFVVGINPRRVNLYGKLWGFKQIGEVKDYEKLKTAPVALLHLSGNDPEIRSLKMNQEIYSDQRNLDFDSRYKFNPNNYIANHEFNASVDSLIRRVWNRQPVLRVA